MVEEYGKELMMLGGTIAGFLAALLTVLALVTLAACGGSPPATLSDIPAYPGTAELKPGESNIADTLAKNNQTDAAHPNCAEDSAYPAAPDSEYGWEKLFSERLYAAYSRNHGVEVRVARFHNIFGPEGTWRGGRETMAAGSTATMTSATSSAMPICPGLLRCCE